MPGKFDKPAVGKNPTHQPIKEVLDLKSQDKESTRLGSVESKPERQMVKAHDEEEEDALFEAINIESQLQTVSKNLERIRR